MIKIAIFASGNGTNAINFYKHFNNHPHIALTVIYCNNAKAGIIEKASSLGIKCIVFNRLEWENDTIIQSLNQQKIDFIVLAGFLWLLPPRLVKAYKNKIINIHPALLPNYGGKGMYGEKVHKKVIDDKASQSGITIHLVNEEYDKGKILFQKTIEISANETSESLATRIHELEHLFYPKVVEKYILE